METLIGLLVTLAILALVSVLAFFVYSNMASIQRTLDLLHTSFTAASGERAIEVGNKLLDALLELSLEETKIRDLFEALKDKERVEERRQALDVLNLCEQIGLGVKNEVYNEHILYEYIAGSYIKTYEDFLDFIDYLREDIGNPKIFYYFSMLAEEWIAKRQREKEQGR